MLSLSCLLLQAASLTVLLSTLPSTIESKTHFIPARQFSLHYDDFPDSDSAFQSEIQGQFSFYDPLPELQQPDDKLSFLPDSSSADSVAEQQFKVGDEFENSSETDSPVDRPTHRQRIHAMLEERLAAVEIDLQRIEEQFKFAAFENWQQIQSLKDGVNQVNSFLLAEPAQQPHQQDDDDDDDSGLFRLDASSTASAVVEAGVGSLTCWPSTYKGTDGLWIDATCQADRHCYSPAMAILYRDRNGQGQVPKPVIYSELDTGNAGTKWKIRIQLPELGRIVNIDIRCWSDRQKAAKGSPGSGDMVWHQDNYKTCLDQQCVLVGPKTPKSLVNVNLQCQIFNYKERSTQQVYIETQCTANPGCYSPVLSLHWRLDNPSPNENPRTLNHVFENDKGDRLAQFKIRQTQPNVQDIDVRVRCYSAPNKKLTDAHWGDVEWSQRFKACHHDQCPQI